MQSRETAANVSSEIFSYIYALGTFFIGSIVDLSIFAILDFYTPFFGLIIVVYNCSHIFTYKLYRYTPTKSSVHWFTTENDNPYIYQMFKFVAPKGSYLSNIRVSDVKMNIMQVLRNLIQAFIWKKISFSEPIMIEINN